MSLFFKLHDEVLNVHDSCKNAYEFDCGARRE